MKRGDIYWVPLDLSGEHKQSSNYPVLVVSPIEFNKVTQLPVICPIVNDDHLTRRIGFCVFITGIKITGVVRCDQPRVLDLEACNAQKIDLLPKEIMDEVLAKLITIFE